LSTSLGGSHCRRRGKGNSTRRCRCRRQLLENGWTRIITIRQTTRLALTQKSKLTRVFWKRLAPHRCEDFDDGRVVMLENHAVPRVHRAVAACQRDRVDCTNQQLQPIKQGIRIPARAHLEQCAPGAGGCAARSPRLVSNERWPREHRPRAQR
jgi:hypothetical protein